MHKKIQYSEEPKLGPTSQKILLLLLGGIALGLTSSPDRYFRILKTIKKDWDTINRNALHRAIKLLYKARLLDTQDNPDGTTTIVLSQRGKQKALRYHIDELKIPKMPVWDKKWRIVLFDIPEPRKKARDALAQALKNMGFITLQKSVFVHPFKCEDEVDFVIEFFNLRPHVRTIIAENIDNELHLKKHFKLI